VHFTKKAGGGKISGTPEAKRGHHQKAPFTAGFLKRSGVFCTMGQKLDRGCGVSDLQNVFLDSPPGGGSANNFS
jgi:hypothetical protein